ncbi:Iron-sulfur cluster assembly protein [Plasmodium coatneyi]|uniref:Iron-sulfur cluster assembly protein n=1 Tax=Plasmodium coatneyi TaxID=208452 RepID=A0A1B1E5B3_9APIC|nr:Iron-sulfur cluster assembly protein [Plasmodium coatneyi]ANQ10213.1 Iron-sulfur cluster assembly protein [Plasmodium coatneyi]
MATFLSLLCKGSGAALSAAGRGPLCLPCVNRNIPRNGCYPCAARSYSDHVKDHFNKPRNVGSFDKNEKNIGTSIVGKASCGDVIKLQLKIEDDVIKDARFMAFGCGSAIASSSYATELIKGKTIDEALKIKNDDIASHLSLPPVKIHCSLLAEDAIKHAIKNYREKVIN